MDFTGYDDCSASAARIWTGIFHTFNRIAKWQAGKYFYFAPDFVADWSMRHGIFLQTEKVGRAKVVSMTLLSLIMNGVKPRGKSCGLAFFNLLIFKSNLKINDFVVKSKYKMNDFVVNYIFKTNDFVENSKNKNNDFANAVK